MTHTPGPWSVFYKHKYNEWHVSVPMAEGSMWAIAPDGIQTDNPEGDARLIAAAPDMLAALKAAVELSDARLKLERRFAGRTPECQAVYDMCAAAIAKADRMAASDRAALKLEIG